MDEPTLTVPTRTPPQWLNRLMATMLRTPGLERLVGRSVALLTLTGRSSGRRYTLPVSYDRRGDTVVVVTKLARRWWRNLTGGAPVELRLAGRHHAGVAHASTGDEAELPTLVAFLEDRPIDARAYGLTLVDGKADVAQVRQLLDLVVVVRITLDQP